jgi:CRP/FNR family transcriptional regulator, cyclic AMP receptor protein
MDDVQLLQRFVREFARGTVLFREGELGREMFVLQSGRVAISKTVGKVAKVLSTMGQGEFFGEMSILCDRPRSATATVVEQARILTIDSKTFEAMVRSNAEVAIRMIKKLAERLQVADDLISNLLLRDVSSRVVHYLVTAAERAARGAGPVRLAVTRGELPGLVGAERAQVEETLAKLLRARIVEIDAKGIVVPEVPKLRHFLDFLQMQTKPQPGGD